MWWRSEVEGVLLLPFASLSAVSFPAMPTCAGTHWSTTLLLSDRKQGVEIESIAHAIGPLHQIEED